MGQTYRQLVDKETMRALNAVAAMNEDVYEKIEEVEDKVDQSLSTWEKLNEDSSFKNLSGRTKVLIWELAKIKENDSPKSQAYLAEQYMKADSRDNFLRILGYDEVLREKESKEDGD